jgi:uncharacterized protein YeaO (DUF488 family)
MATDGSTTGLPTIELKRAYEAPEARDGVRVSVDRLWARGVSMCQSADSWRVTPHGLRSTRLLSDTRIDQGT